MDLGSLLVGTKLLCCGPSCYPRKRAKAQMDEVVGKVREDLVQLKEIREADVLEKDSAIRKRDCVNERCCSEFYSKAAAIVEKNL